jgi:hypothetical protein
MTFLLEWWAASTAIAVIIDVAWNFPGRVRSNLRIRRRLAY